MVIKYVKFDELGRIIEAEVEQVSQKNTVLISRVIRACNNATDDMSLNALSKRLALIEEIEASENKP